MIRQLLLSPSNYRSRFTQPNRVLRLGRLEDQVPFAPGDNRRRRTQFNRGTRLAIHEVALAPRNDGRGLAESDGGVWLGVYELRL